MRKINHLSKSYLILVGHACANNKSRHTRLGLLKWAKLWRIPELPNRIKISFSCQLRRSLGRVLPRSGVVTLNANLATAPRAVLLEVLCHEVAHVAACQLHGPGVKPHGPEWQALVRAAGYHPSVAMKCRWVPQPPSVCYASRRLLYSCPVCHTDYFVGQRNSYLHCSSCFNAGVIVTLRLMSKP